MDNATTTAPLPTVATDPVGVARTLVPLLARLAEAAERERKPSDEAIQAIRQAGLFQMMFPRRAGGAGHPLMRQIETIAELGKGCPGTAWAVGLLTSVTASVASMPPLITEQVFKTGQELFCSVAGQTGTAQETEDGYLVNGSWGYGSGCMHATHAMNGVRVLDAQGNTVDAGFAILALDGEKTVIRDTWNVAGLAASGSNTIVATNVRLPKTLVLRFSQMRRPTGADAAPGLEPRDRWPMEPLFPLGVLSPMLGAASALLEHVRDNLPKRPMIGWNYPNQAGSEVFVNQLGEAALEIDSAWLHIRRAVSEMDGTAQTRALTGFEKARIQADCGYAMRQLRRAGERLMEIAGPGAFATHSPVQRLWRDLSLGTRHTALNSNLSAELYGRALLGQESNLMLLSSLEGRA